MPLLLQVFITIISHLLTGALGPLNIALIHLIPILVIALHGDMVATMIITTVSVVLFDLLYVPPQYSFNVNDLVYVWSFILFYIVGYIITVQAKQIHTTFIKDILLNTLSHDLKTPLSSILGNTSILLQQDNIAKEDQKDILLQIKNSSQKMNRLILNLLDSARLQNGKNRLHKEWCDFEDLIGLALQEFDKEQDKFDISIDHGLKLFWGDSVLLARLLVNLMDNGLKYSNDNNVQIIISATSSDLSIRFFNESTFIKKADLQNMFEKFYRLDNSVDIQGSGIGLSICRDIAMAHGGVIQAYAEDGGIYIEVSLPIVKDPKEILKESV